MSGIIEDIDVINKKDFKEIKKNFEGKILKSVKKNGDDLLLIFENKKLKISMQWSDTYGTNVFFWVEEL